MSAVALLARARDAGVDVRVHGGDLRLRGTPDADLVQAIREAKPALVAILRGDTPAAGAASPWHGLGRHVVEAAGTALHHDCYQASEFARLLASGRRAVESPAALADEAEMMLHPEEER
jgi:hypothetical protein